MQPPIKTSNLDAAHPGAEPNIHATFYRTHSIEKPLHVKNHKIKRKTTVRVSHRLQPWLGLTGNR